MVIIDGMLWVQIMHMYIQHRVYYTTNSIKTIAICLAMRMQGLAYEI